MDWDALAPVQIGVDRGKGWFESDSLGELQFWIELNIGTSHWSPFWTELHVGKNKLGSKKMK